VADCQERPAVAHKCSGSLRQHGKSMERQRRSSRIAQGREAHPGYLPGIVNLIEQTPIYTCFSSLVEKVNVDTLTA
jgi:hypothetical protein